MFDEYTPGDSQDEPPDEYGAPAGPRPPAISVPVPGRSHEDDMAFLKYVRDGLAALDSGGTAREHHEKIGMLEEIKGAAAGAQVMSATLMETDIVARRTEAGVRENNPAYGVGSQVAFARRESQDQGRASLGFAGRLIADLPFTLIALVRGKISESQARAIDRETEHLPAAQRGEVDASLLRNPDGLNGLCMRALVDKIRTLAYEYDSSDALTRLEEAKAHRHFSVFPARDAMMQVAGSFSVEDALAVAQALRAEAQKLKEAGDERTLAQIMADVAVDRITGRSRAEGTPIMLNLVITDHTLFQGSSAPAHLMGYGTVPSTWARMMIAGREPQDQGTLPGDGVPEKDLHPPGFRGTGGHGFKIPPIPQGTQRPHQHPRQVLPDPLVQRTDQALRPRAATQPRRTNQRSQRGRPLRQLQPNQGTRRLGRACRRHRRAAHHRDHHPIGATYTSTAPPLPGTPA